MKRIAVASVVILLLAALTALAQTASTPSAEQKKFGVFIGSWTGDGRVETTPFGKGGIVKSTMTCSWFTGGFQLVCNSEDVGPMGKISSHSIYGYNAEKKQNFSFSIDSSGFDGPGTAKVDGSTWTFDGTATMGGKTFWFRTVVKLGSPTEITYKGEYSEDGKTWKPQAEGKLTKKS
jgi:hypothetical protein